MAQGQERGGNGDVDTLCALTETEDVRGARQITGPVSLPDVSKYGKQKTMGRCLIRFQDVQSSARGYFQPG